MSGNKAALILEDGTAFEGKPFGAAGEAFGEAVFTTGVVGYQELLTNPSYAGTLAVLTYPIIGSYGVNDEDNESDGVHVRGIVVREYSRTFSNFRATGSLEDFLKEHGVVGIREVDTRAVTVHLRDHGEMGAAIVSGNFDVKAIARKLKKTPSPFGGDLVEGLTWEGVRPPKGPTKHRIVLVNLGAKNSLLAQLAVLGCEGNVLACTACADEVLAKKPDGVIVAGGPGDPRVRTRAIKAIAGLLGKVRLLGIGLGHQALALALGCKVKRMKTGHRGVNYPVRDVAGGRSLITVQHHSFVVDGERLPRDVAVAYENLNDGTVEGIRSRHFDAAGLQFHPCPDEMGEPSLLLKTFCEGGLPPARAKKRRRRKA